MSDKNSLSPDSATETFGELFDDGSMIDLVRDDTICNLSSGTAQTQRSLPRSTKTGADSFHRGAWTETS